MKPVYFIVFLTAFSLAMPAAVLMPAQDLYAKSEEEKDKKDDAEESEPEMTVTSNTTTGTVVALRNNNLSLETGNIEMLIPLADDVEFVGFQKTGDLKYGDTVRVTYDKSTQKNELNEDVLRDTKGKKIELLEKGQVVTESEGVLIE